MKFEHGIFLNHMNEEEIPLPRQIGLRIQAARNAKHWSLQNLCDQTDWLGKSTLGNWESGIRLVGIKEASKLAALLGVTVEHILCLDDSTLEESALLAQYRRCDTRGKVAILRMAESEAELSAGKM